MHREDYTTEKGFYHAQLTERSHLGKGERERAYEDGLRFHGRDVREIARFGSWTIRYYADRPETCSGPAEHAFYAASGVKGLTRGHDTLLGLIDDLREWDARELPECTCEA